MSALLCLDTLVGLRNTYLEVLFVLVVFTVVLWGTGDEGLSTNWPGVAC